VLGRTLAELVREYAWSRTGRGLDVGCQNGELTDVLTASTELRWCGIDPAIEHARRSAVGAELLHGWADELPFPDAQFDCAILANVYEHIPPDRRSASLAEIWRVLGPGGTLIGQLPNPLFPIESHSRLPFMGWLPLRARLLYWRLAPVPWEHDFYVVTIGQLRQAARAVGYDVVLIRNFNYPTEAIPRSVRRLARVLAAPMRLIPWSWQFVLRKPPPAYDRGARDAR
jgi:SAM-dependent methyltransferase